ncbi:Na+/H+ antiporter NhaA [Citrobacter sp. MAL-2]|uniref:Na(+)/H(+) antiporter NhaA n=1 Tax=Citrobacter amalonaticus TaxID=35703 RepID=A0A9C7V303_CITAM|nr:MULTISPECIES: Na+/H+ antiporter NhaA [Enterobacterales]ECJ6375104.1 Na+/H+ antiporter NhaA [Salmonella enterica subsp. enterica serovar Rissen]EEN1699345.1 Na+/H+ antiporter NhaA [Salmonella enterica subsp. enterica]EGD1507177.1 Na+/H+ antiporter NhaA [Salmonella enterica]EJR3890336.1 Na+/H+ antiporter NhaA [Salmonella enterica subsp. enterica serovar Anatum]MDL8863908.1 Na+/H+ antiporter NhaA [Escherichia coli]HCD1255893.1 Na+/H+ antiporter NhaA [Citrobacter amalonaticus]HDT3093780.1 Na+
MSQYPSGMTGRVIKPVSDFFSSPIAGGVVLILASLAAITVANSPLRAGYEALLDTKAVGLSVEHWINDALMAAFFMMVGLEIKRELLIGQLSTWSQRALPGFAAIGGMVVPALIYVGLNRAHPDTLAGWAIPAATDIAFALGVLALLGSRVPPSLKIFLSALAILDDMGAVTIIALFYTSDISLVMLGAAAVMVALLILLNRTGVTRLLPYILTGALLWYFMLQSGVHATIAGILLAFCIPLRTKDRDGRVPLDRLEHIINPWVTFLILPLFGFANAGVALSGMTMDDLLSSVPVGVAMGLFLGKQVGIFGLSLLAVKLGIACRPENSNWIQVYGVSVLCGIGFTMSLFIGNLAFAGNELLIDEVKVGVLAGSLLAVITGMLILRLSSNPTSS